MRETHTSFVLSRFLYLQLVLKQSKSFYRKPIVELTYQASASRYYVN